MNREIVLPILRHTLTGLGAGLAGQGLASADDINAIVGGVIAVISVVWMILEKRAAAAKK